MYTDTELLTFIPSKQKDNLTQVIGKKLLEIERFFEMDLKSFLEYSSLTPVDFFSWNSGVIKLSFESSLIHNFTVYGSQLSIVLLPCQAFSGEAFGQWYQLSRAQYLSSENLRNCLGQICQDVRIWTLREDFESEEAKEVAVSYLLADGSELFYCIYLHEDLDSDYLLLKPDVDISKAASCFSLKLGEYIEPKPHQLVSISKFS